MLPAAPYRDGADGQHSLQPARRPLLRRFRRGVAAVARAVHPRDDARVAGADARPLVSGADAPSVRDLQLQPQTRLASRTLWAGTTGRDRPPLLAAHAGHGRRRRAGGRGVSGDFAVRKRLTSALAGKRMPTEASAFVERCNPGLILPVFRPDKEFSGRHPIGKLAHVHAVFCPALAGLAAIIMLLEIFHRISGKTHRVVRAPALGFRGTHKLALEVRRSARCYERRSYRDFATKLQAVDRDRVNLGNVGFGVPVLRRTLGINRQIGKAALRERGWQYG